MTKPNTEIVAAFLQTYNAGDDEGALSLCTDDVKVTHHNRNTFIDGKEAFRAVLTAVKELIPDKHFENRRAIHVDGDNVIVEHSWVGNALADLPGFASKGEAINLDLCTRYTFRDGKICEYHDYG